MSRDGLRSLSRIVALWGTALLSACGGVPEYLSGLDGGTTGGVTSGLPCAVSTVLQNNCISCHGSSNPMGGVSLASYAALTATSTVDTSMKVVQRAIARMNDGSCWQARVDVVVTLAACIEG